MDEQGWLGTGTGTPTTSGDSFDTAKSPFNVRFFQITNFCTWVVLLSNPFRFIGENAVHKSEMRNTPFTINLNL